MFNFVCYEKSSKQYDLCFHLFRADAFIQSDLQMREHLTFCLKSQ